MPQELTANVKLINDKVKFSACTKDNPAIITDYTPPLGDNEGYTSLELFLISLANCSGVAVISLLRKMQRNITDFRVMAKGYRKDEHPTCFSSVDLEFEVHSYDVQEGDLQKAIKISEEQICPVWAMIDKKVPIHAVGKIIRTQ